MANEFVGAGWAFPLELDQTGAFRLVTDDREIEQAIRLIIGTSPGERPMRPEFGCAIHDFVFAEANAATAGQIAVEV
jgi:phage baseplate assembly protein W